MIMLGLNQFFPTKCVNLSIDPTELRPEESPDSGAEEEVQESEAEKNERLESKVKWMEGRMMNMEQALLKRDESMTALKRKIQETIQCNVCLTVTREGQVLQCQNGHIFCEGCNRSNADDNSDQDSDNDEGPRSNNCPTCRTPLQSLTGNKRIRALGIEQLIEVVGLELQCKYDNCEFKTTSKSNLKSHHAKCEQRLVRCPDSCGDKNVTLCGLVDHLRLGNCNSDAPSSYIYRISKKDGILEVQYPKKKEKDFIWKKDVFSFQNKHFLAAFEKNQGDYYAFVYILGDAEEAKNYFATISAGHGSDDETGCRRLIADTSNVFPIDKGDVEIVDAGMQSGNIFSIVEDLPFFEPFFEPQDSPDERLLLIRYQIRKAKSPNSEQPKLDLIEVE